ncbi:MAG TPA: hypothetical protein VL125_04455 [Pelobium sp.]|nr:hypothetical protein [Pelobium sp.]
MNVYINYQFNFGHTLTQNEHIEESGEFDHLIQLLNDLMNQVSATNLRETVFRLLMEYVVKHGEGSRNEMKEVYFLLEFLKVMGEVQGKMVEG